MKSCPLIAPLIVCQDVLGLKVKVLENCMGWLFLRSVQHKLIRININNRISFHAHLSLG